MQVESTASRIAPGVTSVTGPMFPVLGLPAEAGRLLTERDDTRAAPGGWP